MSDADDMLKKLEEFRKPASPTTNPQHYLKINVT